MKKTISKALASAALTALIAGIVSVGQVSAAIVNPDSERLSGKDRYLTAVEVSKIGWTNSADYAVIVNGEDYADALSAAPFAKKNNAPILLTSSKGITNETLNELKRLKPKKVYVIGGIGVAPNSILETIKKNVTADVERIGGQDRYATSTKIAEKLGTVNEAMLASGEGYADALSAAPVAAVKGIPVLLTKAGELPKATSDYIKAQGIKKTFVVGGAASISDKVKTVVPNAIRIGGKNRWETNSEIIRNFALDFNFDGAYMALANGMTGKEFADALTASAIAAKDGRPVIISNKTADVATNAIISEKLSPTAKITAIGGTANLSDALIKTYQLKGEVIEASKDVTGNAVVSKDNLSLSNMKVKGNLYIEGNNAAVTNVEVSGTVFVNPGKEGNAVLNNVTADKIIVLSGANNGISFKNVNCNTLYVTSKIQTRVVLEGTNIKNVEIFSSAILDVKDEFKGVITVLNNLYMKNVEFLGKYSGTITVKSDNDNIKMPGDDAQHQYSLSIASKIPGFPVRTISLGSNDTLANVYDEVIYAMKPQDNAYEALVTLGNIALNKMENTTAGEYTVREYIANKLLAKNSNSIIGHILKTGGDTEMPDSNEIANYIASKDFNTAYNLLNDKTGGTITIPKLMGDTRTVDNITITIDGKENIIDNEANISEILSLLGINPLETTLSEIQKKDFTIHINFGDTNPYIITAEDGILTIDLNSTYTITLQ
ncbi:cell wall-binding repeat-containing protein [Clostridium sp. BSD9I1]|uniref:cell wall-binding repeat-containing protein n=1 Tax=Clostridium sp. BSD9I1 TaxID=2003589 RepID=UPI0016481415|nr:cell wall-binding repeat-containing protein [Clostridium sp. BSD9I1]